MTALTTSYVLPRRGDICDVKKFSYRKMIEISKLSSRNPWGEFSCQWVYQNFNMFQIFQFVNSSTVSAAARAQSPSEARTDIFL